MGIYDRDYVRRDGSSFFGPILERGTVCKWLIGITVALFLVQMLNAPRAQDLHDNWIFEHLTLKADAVLHGEVWRLITYPFIYHPGSPWPILWGMLFLWFFGRDLEDIYGPREFLAYYFGSILLGGLVFVGVVWAGGGFMPIPYSGAGVALAAILVLCALHYPRRIIYLFLLLPVPIWLVAVGSVGLDLYSFFKVVGIYQQARQMQEEMMRNLGAAVPDVLPKIPILAFAAMPAASLAAAAFALFYYKYQWRVSALWPDFRSWQKARRRPRLRVYREQEPELDTPVHVPAGGPPEDAQLEAKVDAILEKISRTGKESLTESERQVLLQASEAIRRRRS